MDANLIQRQIPIGSEVVFYLKNDRKVSGILVEIGIEHVTLKDEVHISTILVEMIGGWDVKAASSIIEPSGQNQENTFGLSSFNPNSKEIQSVIEDAQRKLFMIKAEFDAQTRLATLTITPPTFIIPKSEFNGKNNSELVKIWERAKSKYTYALKVNELSPKFGRVQDIVGDLRSLSDLLPNSAHIKKHLAYVYWLIGNSLEALSLYKDSAVISTEAIDWQNLAAIAMVEQQEKLALFSLEQYFKKASPSQSSQAWFLFVKLIIQQSSQFVLGNYEPKDLSIDDAQVVFQTGIYLFELSDRNNQAIDFLRKLSSGITIIQLAKDILIHFKGQPDTSYQDILSEMNERPQSKTISIPIQNKSQGVISSYKADRKFGFIRGDDGSDYFFHRSAISDDELLEKISLTLRKKIPVEFEVKEGPKGALAVNISMIRAIDEMYDKAVSYVSEGEYPRANALIKKVIEADPNYKDAQVLYNKWREYARSTTVPKGSNPYARAKRVQLIEKDLDRAAELFLQAINKSDNLDSAVKDLAALLNQQGKISDAIDVLLKNRLKMWDQRSVDNMLIAFYQNAEMFDEARTLLQEKYFSASTIGKKAQLLWQIANGYFRQEKYPEAEKCFRELIDLQSDNNGAQRNLAICLFKQGRHEDAKNILDKILSTFPDPQVADLLDAIIQAESGLQPQLDDKIIETTLSSFSSETSGFTQFFLQRCDFQGVKSERVQKQAFDQTDIKSLESLASKLSTSRPRDRAAYYLSAARIVSLLDDEDPNMFFRYLCRSFASRGDAAVIDFQHLDSAREFYCESVNAYDGDRGKRSSDRRDEQDAVNAIVRYLFSTLGHEHIPIKPNIPSLDDTLETVFRDHPDRNKLFDSISYLILRSRYAANRIINRLYNSPDLQTMALEYIKSKSGSSEIAVKDLDGFIRMWNVVRLELFKNNRAFSYEIRFIGKTELTTASLEGSIRRVEDLVNQPFFELDQQRISELKTILETALELCKQFTFEEQERLCVQIESRCQDLLSGIESTPTKLSVEEIYPVIDQIREKVSTRLLDLYESSAPQLTLRLPVESYTPDNNQQIDIQITVNNRIGCSPAEAIELVVQEYAEIYSLAVPEIKSESSLRGGDQRILKIPICLGKEALESQTFSFPVYVQYRTRSSEIVQTPVNNFSIRLYSESEFEPIDNPYAVYAEGGVVGDPNMFFGRDEMIENVARAIRDSKSQSKCVVIYGQKRAGKSSILFHLKKKLELDENLLILDIGNIGKYLDDHSSSAYPFLHIILWSIIRKLELVIEDRLEAEKPCVKMVFPSNERDFFEHPSPLIVFNEIFETFKRQAEKNGDSQNMRIVLLIDEFQYIYAQILAGRIPKSFMTNWKALLQEGFFSAVLVGQDVMPKFKELFPNEFGTTQDERVSYLKRDDAIKLIDEPVRVGGPQGESRFREQAIERIISLTAGSPFYIQILCNRLVEYMNRKRARLVTEADVEQVKDELVRGANAFGLEKFDNLLNSGDTSKDAISDSDALKVLTEITFSSLTGPCNRNNIKCETAKSIDEILDDLVKRDVVERERGQFYSIRVGLFKEWLIKNQSGKLINE